MKKILSQIIKPKRAIWVFLILFLFTASGIFYYSPKINAACNGSNYGSGTGTFNTTSAGSYRIWSRVMASSATNNSFYLQIDNGTCIDVGTTGSVSANQWTWVDYKGGNQSSKNDVTLSVGSHNFGIYGKSADLKIDRIVMTSDKNCVPTNDGDNCATVAVDPPTGGDLSDICGTWVIQQVSSVQELSSNEAKIKEALDLPGVVGFSVRFPWNAADISGPATTHALLDKAKEISDSKGKALSIRFMAGRHVPDRVFTAGAKYYTYNNEKIGIPWDSSDPNTYKKNQVWLDEYDKYVQKLVNWSKQNDVKLIHLSWWAQDWAELNHGKEVRAVAGYSKNNWLAGHKEIIDIGAKYANDASNNVSMEVPMSGYGPVASDMSPALTDHIVSKVGQNTDKFFIQANGWSDSKEWGAPDDQTEAAFDTIWQKPVKRGLQAIQPDGYDWNAAYARLGDPAKLPTQSSINSVNATYAEVYLPSFWQVPGPFGNNTQAKIDQLKSAILAFSQKCPTGGSSQDTTLPVVSMSASPASVTAGAEVTLTAVASDNVGVTKVEFYDGTSLLATDSASPYTFKWNTTGVANGAHALKARAFDAAGNVATSTDVSVTVQNSTPSPDTTNPTATVTNPLSGSTVYTGTNYQLKTNASDNVGVTKVEFYRAGQYLIGTATLASGTAKDGSWAVSWTPTTAGSADITARVYDASGNIGNSPVVSVSVSSQPTTNPADINKDSKVDIFDLSTMLSKWGTSDQASDINNDNKVDVFDLSILLSNWTG